MAKFGLKAGVKAPAFFVDSKNRNGGDGSSVRIFQVVKIMIINSYVQALNSVYTSNSTSGPRRVSRVERPEARDEVVLSGEAQSFKDMFQELRNQDEVRPDKVAEFTEKIESGSYHVGAENIAASILGTRF